MRYSRRVVSGVSLALVLALAGCNDGAGGLTGADPDRPRASQAVERDIEAPEVFSKRDTALWDGRPSLGGVWVAHPDARTPERVIIRNTESGRETIGALFKRERMNPGPIFQVSADAAAAVGMLAGAPTGIEVIALRTEDVRPAQDPDAVPVADPAAEPVATAVATTEPPPTAATPQTGAQPDTNVAAAGETMITLTDATAETPSASPRGGFLGRLFGRRSAPDAPAAPEGIETQVLADTVTDTAPAATVAPMPTPMAAPAPAAAPAPVAASALTQPFIQLGIFSVEANANRAQTLARDAGLSARVIKGQTQGNDFWRVTVGPATNTTEQRDLLARVKALGFNDAYTVRR